MRLLIRKMSFYSSRPAFGAAVLPGRSVCGCYPSVWVLGLVLTCVGAHAAIETQAFNSTCKPGVCCEL